MEQFILSGITEHVQEDQGIRPRRHGFTKVRSCIGNLISFYDMVACSLHEGKIVSVVYLEFSKEFDITSPSILLEKLAAQGLDGYTFPG
ncbi:rna-directed dna polymerase from mobile element jockey-like [Willisornis vidua]|uniref:Rna-directed dna polymerase from mobile element jockey-like n=1 Tax=Willisornis vidua TaxID=1566151 RepID=A0ABQ9CRA6_9PASS|nr:rna-directed dna polymerase from mobile element jockey-like [Willisornis vidua]